jgi:hypothetical protein
MPNALSLLFSSALPPQQVDRVRLEPPARPSRNRNSSTGKPAGSIMIARKLVLTVVACYLVASGATAQTFGGGINHSFPGFPGIGAEPTDAAIVLIRCGTSSMTGSNDSGSGTAPGSCTCSSDDAGVGSSTCRCTSGEARLGSASSDAAEAGWVIETSSNLPASTLLDRLGVDANMSCLDVAARMLDASGSSDGCQTLIGCTPSEIIFSCVADGAVF